MKICGDRAQVKRYAHIDNKRLNSSKTKGLNDDIILQIMRLHIKDVISKFS